MRAMLPSLSSPLRNTGTVAATVIRHVRTVRCPEPPWSIPEPKYTPPEPLLFPLQSTRIPMSLRQLKLCRKREKLASEARVNNVVSAEKHGSVGNAVWSLACLLEDVTVSAMPAGTKQTDRNTVRVLRDGRCCLVRMFQWVFSASPNLAVGIIALTAELVAASAKSLMEDNFASSHLRTGYEGGVTDYELLFELENWKPNSIILSNYAQFLYQCKKDYERAKKYFELSVKAEPIDAEVLSRYALFLWHQQGDTGTADKMFLQAIATDPENSYHRSNYASFLHETGGADACHPLDVSKNELEADTLDKEVQSQSWSDIGILDDMPEKQMLSSDCSLRYIRRKNFYERTIIGGKVDSLILSNYAQLLYQYEKDSDRADYYFKLAVATDPVDAEAMGRYAFFLWQERADLETAEEMFLNATAADPENHYHQRSYAWFLWQTGATDTCYPLDDCGTAEDEEDNEQEATDL